ncbi:MAG: hypothetical protein K9M49_04655 [Candidatus Marinimicrobia bacterium]|nr:hypothetical protein [Candidatus Neomarinimicrobiota bacterium]MCF7904428.1 hypothetical protein [Candidatus Neomarinimicrobiota bacterium]
MKNWLVRNFLVLLVVSTMHAFQSYDTGWILFHQPNGTSFTARYWGDPYLNWYETSEGYRFVGNRESGWFYAVLGNHGGFKSSGKMVGVDTPPVSSYKLKRSHGHKSMMTNLRNTWNSTSTTDQVLNFL